MHKINTRDTGLGLDLRPGDDHYRAYVGPPKDYDLVSAMVFNLLTCLGLRQHHKLLDIGCGSLRVGRLFIPYLNSGNYIGIEPNKWLVESGIQNEIGQDLINIKSPVFSFQSSMSDFKEPLNIDFAVAQSIFSHCGTDLITEWLSQVETHLSDNGALLATFLVNDKDNEVNGWIYPGCVQYKPETMKKLAADCGLNFQVIDWTHPRQTWGIFSKKSYDTALIDDASISWNKFISNELKNRNSTTF